MQHIVIIGATSSIAENCARLWLQVAPIRLDLVGRDLGRTNRLADDLRVRSPNSIINVLTTDFVKASAIKDIVKTITITAAVDLVLIAHGMLSDQIECQNDLQECEYALLVNGLSPVLFAEAFAKFMVKANHGTIAIIGSVAGDRGRSSNYIYGAAKGLVARYAQGMQHRLACTAVKVILIKAGPTDTPMTSKHKAEGKKLASAKHVSLDIVKAISSGKLVLYTPSIWYAVMFLIIHLPRLIFNKLNI